MNQKPLSILISGAGIAGSSLALMLARHPAFTTKPIITLVERSQVPRTTGQAVDIRGPAVDVIKRLGLEPEIKARHTGEVGVDVVNAQGKTIAQLDATGDAQNQSATSEYEILRGDLAGLLFDGVNEVKEKGAKINIVYGEKIVSMEDGEHGVDVKFANGKVESQRFDVVVAADGIGSEPRAMIFGKDDRKEHVQPSGLYIGFFTIPRIEEDDERWKWCAVPNGKAMHLRPHRNNKTMGAYLSVCNAVKDRSPELEKIVSSDVATQKDYLRTAFKDVGWQSERFIAALDKADDFYMTHWCKVRTPKWAKGRCVILGDAAFATMGVGTSLAMTGAYVIAGELANIKSSDQVSAALERYEEVFRPYVDKNDMATPGFPQLAAPQTAGGLFVLQTVTKVVFGSGLPRLLSWLFGGKKESWVLPDYGWQSEAKSP